MKLTSIRHLLGALALCLALSGFGQTIAVDQLPRPLARAAEELEHKYGVLINYEDPPYVFPQDIDDLTARGAVHQNGPNPHHILVPAAGSLTLSTSLIPNRNRVTTDEAKGLVANLLEAYHTSGNIGTFTSSQTDDVFTIFPAQYRGRTGAIQDIKPILSTPISIEPQTVTTAKALEILFTKINDAVGHQEIGPGIVPSDSVEQQTMQLSASNEPARNILKQILAVIEQGDGIRKCRLVYRLLYGPDVQRYALNIHAATLQKEQPTGRGKRSVLIQ